MPIEQEKPYHHENRGRRSHALLSHEELRGQMDQLAEGGPNYHNGHEMTDWIRRRGDELREERRIRDEENRIEPGVSLREVKEIMDNVPRMRGRHNDKEFRNWMHQPFDEDFQDKNASDDVFEQAWGVMKAKDDGWFEDSRFPLPDDVCENCEGKKDPNDEMCRACMRRMLGV